MTSHFPSSPHYGSGPIAWQAFVVPVHPGTVVESEAA